MIRVLVVVALLGTGAPSTAPGQDIAPVRLIGDSVSVRLNDIELRSAVQMLGRYLDRPIIIGTMPSARVTLETPAPVAKGEVLRLLRGLLDMHNIDLVADSVSTSYRLRPREGARQAGGPTQSSQRGGSPAPQSTGPELFSIQLRHARAVDVSATVNALYGRTASLGELGDARQNGRESISQAAAATAPATSIPSPQAVPGAAGRSAALAGDVTIVPDPRGNMLLVRASRTDFVLIQAAVNQLDVRPLQVLIEVLIAEVRRDRRVEFGVSASVGPHRISGTENTTVQATTISEGLGDFAVKVMGISGLDVDATLRAAAARGDATIVSRPLLLAANNERAEINVGSQRPFVQVSRVLPTDNATRDQVVQYKDVGTRLSVVPTISADGHVMLQVSQEVNSATSEQQFNAPVISTRSIDTRLLVNNGQTIVLGGLTDNQKETAQQGVPFLSSIPIIGGLFGHYGRRTTNTELFVFLTPRVIRSDVEADSLTNAIRARSGIPKQ